MPPVSVGSAADWVARYGRAWVERDSELAADLFTDDAVYHQTPFGPHFRGRTEIRHYWVAITAAEAEIEFQAGEPIVMGNAVACEWWVTMLEHDRPTTLPGCLILRMASDGRCAELREYWEQRSDRTAPHPGWGRIHGDAVE